MRERLSRRDFLSATGAIAAGACLPNIFIASEKKEGATPPNVIYIMTDQQRYDTLRCNGNLNVQTPSFDRLAAEGVRFESCFATQPVCSPSRSSMVTGLFPHATGVYDNNIPLDPKLFSWPRAMREAGYRVAYIGKWHLGTDPVPGYFDVWHGYNTGWPHWIKGEKPVYRPDEETDFAIKFIRENRDRPFLCWLSFYPPHTPKTAPEENLALYEGKIEPHEQAVYHAMVNRLDWNVGRLVRAVDDLGIRRRTLIVFTSDHGENFPARWNQHHKRLCYDQAALLPLILSRPGTLPEGKVLGDLISIADLAPTILDLSGLPFPKDLHGRSAKGLLEGHRRGWHEAVLIENRPYRLDAGENAGMEERCVVTADWKFILNTDRPPELFSRRADPEEKDNLYGRVESDPITESLAKRLGGLGSATEDPLTPKLIEKWITG